MLKSQAEAPAVPRRPISCPERRLWDPRLAVGTGPPQRMGETDVEPDRTAAAASLQALYKKYGFFIARRLAVLGVPPQRGSVARVFQAAGAEVRGATELAPSLVELLAALAQISVRDIQMAPFSRRDCLAFAITYARRVEGLDEETVGDWLGVSVKQQEAALRHFERLEQDDSFADAHALSSAWTGATPSSGATAELELERHLVGDLCAERAAAVEQTLRQSTDEQARFDRLLKQRLIFLADNPPERFLTALEALGPRPQPTRPPRPWKRHAAAIPAAAVAVIALTATALFLQVEPRAGVDEQMQATIDAATAEVGETGLSPTPQPSMAQPRTQEPTESPDAAAVEPPATAVDAVVQQPVAAAEVNTAQEPSLSPTTQPASHDEARLILRARAGSQTRILAEGDTLTAEERLVPWAKVDKAGWVGVLSLRDDGSVRVYVADDGYAVEIAADGPTRLSGVRSLFAIGHATRETIMLLYAPQRFPVRPIAQALRRGDRQRLDAFAGSVSQLSLGLPAAAAVGAE